MQVQEIVDSARMVVFTPVAGPTEALRQLAAEYKELCERINDRLAQCAEFLRKGARSEALRLAEMEPNLLDLVSFADFPERDSFLEICQYLGLDVAPPLLVEVAAELNEAYAREQPLEGLLRRYRRYALQRAPLKKRLAVLRQLAQMDPQNVYWRKDLEVFEKERLEEIRKEVVEAVQKQDLGTLQALEQEVQQTDWWTLPPERLLSTIQMHREMVGRQIVRNELAELNRQLDEAWERFDVAEARRIRSLWQQMAQLAQLASDDPLAQEAGPAFAWLEEEDRKEAEELASRQALSNLERALYRGEKNLPKLEKLYREATRTGRQLPPHVERSYQLRVTELQQAAKRRMGWNLAFGLLGVAILATSAAWGIVTYRTYQDHRHATETLQKLLALIENSPSESLAALQQAKTLVDQLEKQNPRYLIWAPLPKLIAKVKGLWEKDRGRQSQFEQLSQQVRQFLEASMPGPLQQLTQKELDFYESKLKQADQLATGDQEKIQIDQLRTQLEELKLRWQKEKDQYLRDQLNPLADQLAHLEKPSGLPLPPTEALQKIRNLNSRLVELAKLHPDVSQLARTELSLLQAKGKNLEKSWEEKVQEYQHQQRLGQRIGDHESFVQELKRYVQQHSNSPRSLAYQRLMEEQTYWNQLDQWNQYARQWNGPWTEREPLVMDQKWLEEFRPWSGFPGNEAIDPVRPYLEALRNRSDAGQQRLRKMLENPPFQEVWVLKHDEKFYYFHQPPQVKPGVTMGIEYLRDYDLNLGKATVSFSDNPLPPVLAPHIPLCKELVSLLKNTNSSNWEKNFCQMAQKVLTAQGEQMPIDPIVRLRLLRDILQVGSKGSYPLKEGFRNWLMRLETGPVDARANWLDPEQPGYAERRRLAAEFLQRFSLSEFAHHQQKAAELWKQFHSHRLPEFRWVGFLVGEGDRWRCELKKEEALREVEGNLYVIVPRLTGEARIVRIGFFQSGQCQLTNLEAKEAWLDGRPIFAKVQEGSGVFREAAP